MVCMLCKDAHLLHEALDCSFGEWAGHAVKKPPQVVLAVLKNQEDAAHQHMSDACSTHADTVHIGQAEGDSNAVSQMHSRALKI